MINPAPILHVEDSEDDQFFLKRAFTEAGIQNVVHCVNDGQLAVDYFSGTGEFANRELYPIPCLVILDLKMPRLHGLEVLKWIRAHKEYKSIVVIILSSSPLRNDVDMAYEFGANSFVVKPLNADQLVRMAKLIKQYWLETNEFPSVSEVHGSPGRLGIKPPRRFNI